MVKKSNVGKHIITVFVIVVLVFCIKTDEASAAEKKAEQVSAARDKQYIDHGWGFLDRVANGTSYLVSLLATPPELISNLPDGTIIRLKSLKTGFGNYYRAIKSVKSGVWELRADTDDAKDRASQFMVMRIGKDISLASEVADGLLLAADPKTLGVTLVGDKEKGDTVLWELVEDESAGATLESCFLRNKATKGVLTASFEQAESESVEINELQSKINSLEKEFPYLQITYAKSSGTFNSFSTAGSKDIKDVLNGKISNGVLKRTGNWVTQDSGKSAAAAGWAAGRKVKIKFILNGDKANEKTIQVSEKKDLILSPSEGPYAQMLSEAYAKHPAAEFKRKLATLSSLQKSFSGLKQSDIGRTGYEGAIFAISQWSKLAIEKVDAIVEDEYAGDPSLTIESGVAKEGLGFAIGRSPEFRGSGQDMIPDFGPGRIISVGPVYSKGFVWFDQTLQKPGMGTILFRALAQDGDVQICFSDAVAPRAIYRIVFGASGNTKTVLYKNDKSVQEINVDQNEYARIAPGMIEQFWVSLNNGLVMVGKGDPGTHILMAWQDAQPADDVKMVGFSTYKSQVQYTDVQKIDDPIVVVVPQKSYVVESKSFNVGTSVKNPEWSTLPLSPADAGTIVFEATGDEDATLVLANDKNEGYAISFGSDGNTMTKIVQLEDDVELCKVDSKVVSLAKLDTGKINKFWVSFYKGLMILGKGDIGKNTFCMYVDSETPKGIFKIGFAGKAKIQNLEIWPEVELGFDQKVSEYVKTHQISWVQGKLNILTPLNYRIIQSGPSVVFKDNLTGMTTYVAATPDPGIKYHFRLNIDSTGMPNLTAGENVKTAEKIKLETSVKMLEAAATVAFSTSQQMSYGTGPELISSLCAIAACSAMGAVGAALSAGQAAVQSKIDEMQKLADRYVYTESVTRTAKGSLGVSEEAKKDRQDFEDKLKAIFGALPDAIAKLDPSQQIDYTSKLWNDALRLITDAYVIEDQGTKKSVVSGLSDLYNSVKNLGLSDETLPVYNRLIDILIKAYNNPYLSNVGDLLDDQNKSNWYLWINNLAKDILSSQKIMKTGIDINFKGEYIWIPVAFSTPGRGSVTFEAKAYSNIFVCFSEKAVQSRGMSNSLYEIIIGKWENKLTAIHRKSLGDAIVEFDHKKLPELSPDPVEFKKYWINIDNGIISGGVGELGQNKLWEYKDPYPTIPVKWVGLSNWLSINTYRNIKVGGPFSASSGLESVDKELNEIDVSRSVTALQETVAPVSVSVVNKTDAKDTKKVVAKPKKVSSAKSKKKKKKAAIKAK